MIAKLFSDRVLVKIVQDETKIGSIIVPDKEGLLFCRGVVVKVGEMKYENHRQYLLAINEGDTVLFRKKDGLIVKKEDFDLPEPGDYRLLIADHIIGVF